MTFTALLKTIISRMMDCLKDNYIAQKLSRL